MRTLIQIVILSLAVFGLYDMVLNIASDLGIGNYVRYYGKEQMILCPINSPSPTMGE